MKMTKKTKEQALVLVLVNLVDKHLLTQLGPVDMTPLHTAQTLGITVVGSSKKRTATVLAITEETKRAINSSSSETVDIIVQTM